MINRNRPDRYVFETLAITHTGGRIITYLLNGVIMQQESQIGFRGHIPLSLILNPNGSARYEHTYSIGAYIQVDNTGIPPLEREHDQYIMEEVVTSGQFNAAEIKKINYCRLYLRAVTVSDLTTTKGDQLDHSKLTGEPSLQSSRPRWHSIHQDKPSIAEWRLWRKANKLWAYPSGRLLVPLGRWLRNQRDRRGEFSAYQYRNRLAVRVEGGFVMCHPQSSALYLETDQVVKYCDIPNEAVPVTVVHKSEACWEVTHRCEAIYNAPRVDWSTFHSFIDSLEPWETDLLRRTRLYVDPRLAVMELQDSFQAGSDGSSSMESKEHLGGQFEQWRASDC
ncbi:hypothetical protein MHU86_4028 [Fragilaria crotonensis]|nr:hypothetical protein MHU86_4028 [Fragilaria crotonensis]